jgi:DNA-binding protein HU-beta
MALSKTDIISAMCAANPKLSRAKHAESFTAVLDAVKTLLMQGNDISLTKFGSFKVKETAERPARNPMTGEKVIVPAYKRVVFKASAEVLKALKEPGV